MAMTLADLLKLKEANKVGSYEGVAQQAFKEAIAPQEMERQLDLEDYKQEAQMQSLKDLQQMNPKAQSFKSGDLSVGMHDPQGALRMLLTPAQQSAETAIGKQIAEYESGGGKSGMEANLGRMEGVKQELENADRGWGTQAAGLLPRKLREIVTPEEISREDRVRTAVLQTARQLLGAQFTQAEGEALMERAYNPRLSAQENMDRIAIVANELRQKKESLETAGRNLKETGYATIGKPGRFQQPAQTTPAPQPQAQNSQANEALNWAKQNPQDPRAKEILKRLGY